MSMTKLVVPNDMQAPLTSLVQVHSRGIDRGWLSKSAAVLTKELSEIRPEHDHSFIHLLAMGSSEKYGPNRNADGFKEAMLRRDHPTFVSDGHVFKHHRNRPSRGDRIYGEIKNAAYNEDMSRVELIIKVPDRDWGEELEKLARDEEVAFSMSVKVPYDVCSRCSNQAPTRMQYCDCMKKHAGQIMDDGHHVHVDNPVGRFFDISKVNRPADRIAYGFRKVASAGPVVTGAELWEQLHPVGLQLGTEVSKQALLKRAMLTKLAEIEKEIELAGDSEVLNETFIPGAHFDGHVSDSLRAAPRKRLAAQLAKMQISLPLSDFLKIMGDNECSCDCCGCSLFRDILSDDSIASAVCSDGRFDIDDMQPGLPHEISSMIGSMIPAFGMSEAPAMRRATIIAVKKASSPLLRRVNGLHKKANVLADQAVLDYAAYKLSLLTKFAQHGNDLGVKLSVLQNSIE